MITFHGNPDIKAALVRRIEAHAEADRIDRNFGYFGSSYGEAPKGCAIGCMAAPARDEVPGWMRGAEYGFDPRAEITDHLGEEFGLCRALVRVVEQVFEWCHPEGDYWQTWTQRVVDAIPVGVELNEEALEPLADACIGPPEGNRAERIGDALIYWLKRQGTPEAARKPAEFEVV